MKFAIPRLVLFLFFVVCFSPPRASAQNGREKDSLRRVIARTEGAEQAEAYDRLTRLYLVEVRSENVLDTLMSLYDRVEALARSSSDVSR